MKHIFYFVMAAALVVSAGCKRDKEDKDVKPATGSIYGAVTDKTTGEPVKSANVQLRPTGETTLTGSDGMYLFSEVKADDYTLNVTKIGYTNLIDPYVIKVADGKEVKRDVQIAKLPPALRTTNSTGQDIAELDLGESAGVTTANFNIFNDGEATLEWDIVEDSEWITNVSKTTGTLQPNKTQGIIITIDRSKLDGGTNTTKLYINSNDGNKELTVKATGAVKTLAVLNTLDVANITAGTATFNGKITNVGSPKYTERGFVYATSTMPTIETTIAKLTAPITDSTVYSVNATGLTLDQIYYVRAYAINTTGTAYSTNEVSFKATALMPTLTTQAVTNISIAAGTATFNGTIVTVGDPAYTERGFVYGTVHNPNVDDNIKKIASGTNIGVFSSNLTGLSEGNTYYVRAYATNIKGTAYGAEVSFDFNVVMPTLTTQAVTSINIGAGTATFNGTIATLGDPAYTERGFVYATTHNPTIDDTKKVASGTGTGVFSANITELIVDQTFYVCAYATNSKGTAYGSEVVLDFNAVMPQVTTQSVTSITETTATFNGSIATIGDPAYTERGFVYSTYQNPTIDDGKIIVDGSSIGIFIAEITELTQGTTYYVRAYASNGSKVEYGAMFNFVAVNPEYVTLASLNIAVQTADIEPPVSTATSAINMCQYGRVSGYSDWRLPTTNELQTIYNVKNSIGGFKEELYWTGIGPGLYVCSPGVVQETNQKVDMMNGNMVGCVSGTIMVNVRCVRSLVADAASNNYTIGNIQVQKTDVGEANRNDAITVCNNSTAEGYTDWRLPTKEEMADIYLNRSALGDFFSANYWTSSFSSGSYSCRGSSCKYTPGAYYSFDFATGAVGGSSTTMSVYKIRCVRTLP